MIGQVKKIGNDILFHAITKGNIHDVIALLQEDECNVNCKNINGATPLHFAVRAENETIIDILLEAGANPNTAENEEIGSNNPMHVAAERNLTKVMDKLIDLGGDITSSNIRGYTTLHVAAINGKTNMVKLLVARGVDVNVRDKFGYSASYWAHKSKFMDIEALLPPPAKRSDREIHDYIQQVWDVAGFKPGKSGKKGKKGKGGKKKKK